jgi:acetylornithine/succinyldiaminopimelate/putrescine aminotransferase
VSDPASQGVPVPELGPSVADGRLVVHRGAGSWVQDPAGRRYLDLTGAAGVVGHRHPAVLAAVRSQIDRLTWTGPHLRGEQVPAVVGALAATVPGARAAFFKDGADALRAAVDVALRGRTGGVVTASGSAAARGVGTPSSGEHPTAIMADLPAGTAVLVVEPHLEGGAPGAWAALARECMQTDVAVVLDETRAGLGRSGALSLANGSALEGLRPDAVAIGDGLSGGFGVLGAVLVLRPDLDLPATSGVGPIQAAATGAVLALLADPDLIGAGAQTALAFRAALGDQVVRGGGGLVIEVACGLPAGTAVEALRRLGVLCAPAGPTHIALFPPLVLSPVERQWTLAQLKAALR